MGLKFRLPIRSEIVYWNPESYSICRSKLEGSRRWKADPLVRLEKGSPNRYEGLKLELNVGEYGFMESVFAVSPGTTS